MDLPVERVGRKITEVLAGGAARLLLRAPTGSGKSTRVPEMLVDEVEDLRGRVMVVQPRRMAARMLAGYLARRAGESVGGKVGYQVRFDTKVGASTRLVFITDGVLSRMLSEDGSLKGVGAVVFDEFHERRIAGDVGLARCLQLQQGERPDLKLVVMSATLDLGEVEAYLGDCEKIDVEGRSFPVDIEFCGGGVALGGRQGRGAVGRETPLWERIASCGEEAAKNEECGDILVFVPGVYEINRTLSELAKCRWAQAFDCMGLHGGMPPDQQDAVISEGGRPKVIVATNIAETSLTLPRVRTVIDSGLARVASFDSRRGFNMLHVEKISRASAAQRAGRAGRTAPGRCLRLWSERDHGQRAEFSTPEVHRLDLAGVVLDLIASGWESPWDFPWLERPTVQELSRSLRMLQGLGALRDGELGNFEVGEEWGAVSLSVAGELMARMPLEPRLGRLVLAGLEYGCADEALFVAAVLQAEELFLRRGGKSTRGDFTMAGDLSDFAADWRAFESINAVRFDLGRAGDLGLRVRAGREVAKSLPQLARVLRSSGAAEALGSDWVDFERADFDGRAEEFGRAMMVAFGDQLAVSGLSGGGAFRLAGARRAKVDGDSVARRAQALVAAEVMEVSGREVVLNLRRCTVVDTGLLASVAEEEVVHEFVAAGRKVVRLRRRVWRDLVVAEEECGEPEPEVAARLLAERVMSGELVLNCWDDKVDQFIERVNFLAQQAQETGVSAIGTEERELLLGEVCMGASRYKEIKNKEVLPVIEGWLAPEQRAALDYFAPPRLKLENGREVKVRYAEGEARISVKAQQLFGVKQTPFLPGGKVRVVVEILAPNQRPWQVTKDLENFWSHGFEQMRKELGGRYPKHQWTLP